MGCCGSAAAAYTAPQEHFFTQYKLGKKLGEGAFGQVRVVIERQTQKELAVKIVDVRERDENGACSGAVSKSRDRVTRTEVDLWQKASSSDCEYVVKLHKSFAEKSLYYMVCEKCQCSFMDRLVEAESMTEADLAKIFRHMLLGVSHTHGVGIVHRDIKPDNFLWGGPNNSTLKLCDYGLAVMMPKTGRLSGVFGTAPYMAPEMLRNEGYDFLADVWSIGSVAYLLVFGSFPYSPAEASAPAMKKAIIEDHPALHFPSPSDAQGVVSGSLVGALDFTKMLLKRVAKQRPTAAEALKHEFVAEKVIKIPDANEFDPLLRKNAHKARSLTQQMRQKRDSTVQHGIDDLLKKLIVKNGGEISGSNIFFSEGDEKLDQEDEEPCKSMEPRMKKRSSRRDVKHSTHSGVIDQFGSITFDMSPNSAMDSRATGKSAPGDVPGLSNR
mmetsp:Transcript_65194/g.153505  ORF Transcript_65194/g.153505 Transcript_65194/m.153505 type:complete len:440 (+) Transcript_65194:101-1420(+)